MGTWLELRVRRKRLGTREVPFETCAPKLDAEAGGDGCFLAVVGVEVEVVGVVAAE